MSETIASNKENSPTFEEEHIIQDKKQKIILNKLFQTPPTAIHTKKFFSNGLSASGLHSSKRQVIKSCNKIILNKQRKAFSNVENYSSSNTIELDKLKENVAKITYSVKTISSKDDEIGISSKRVPMNRKNPESEKYYRSEKCSTMQASHVSSIKTLENPEKKSDPVTVQHQQFYSKPFTVGKRRERRMNEASTCKRIGLNPSFLVDDDQSFMEQESHKAEMFADSKVRVLTCNNNNQCQSRAIKTAKDPKYRTHENKRLKYQQQMMTRQLKSQKTENRSSKRDLSQKQDEQILHHQSNISKDNSIHPFSNLEQNKKLLVSEKSHSKISLSEFLSRFKGNMQNSADRSVERVDHRCLQMQKEFLAVNNINCKRLMIPQKSQRKQRQKQGVDSGRADCNMASLRGSNTSLRSSSQRGGMKLVEKFKNNLVYFESSPTKFRRYPKNNLMDHE